MSNFFILNYDKDDNLSAYTEIGQDYEPIFHCKFENNTFKKYDFFDNSHSYVEYCKPCQLMHRFEAGESWLSIIEKSKLNTKTRNNYDFPDLRSQYTIKDGQLVIFTINKSLVKQYKGQLISNR